MPCQEIQSWTFNDLVGAFLDLAVAYLLLCAAAFVYLVSKFLGLFGTSLPCPCDGLFSDPSKNKCFQEVLINSPVEKIATVQGSVKGKMPFDSILGNDPKRRSKLKRVRKEERETDEVELEGEASCSSFRGKGSEDVFGILISQSLKDGSSEVKGKGFSVHRSRYGLRNRQKIVNRKKFPSTSIRDNLQLDAHAFPQSPARLGNNTTVNCEEDRKASEETDPHNNVSRGFEFDEPSTEDQLPEKNSSLVDETNCSSPVDLGFDENECNTIRVLEQALEKEQAARDALLLELEKERSAAATAADEAMAMILRLQEEKASVEMEARQYQRMIEEKSAFDAEEMNILKEILLRRERETHFLEKEVEAYRQMLLETEQSESNLQDMEATQRTGALLSSKENPELMSHQIENSVLGFGDALAVPYFDDDAANCLKIAGIDQDLVNNKPAYEQQLMNRQDEPSMLTRSSSQSFYVDEKTINPVPEKHDESDKSHPSPDLVSEASKVRDETNIIIPCSDDKIEKCEEDSHNSCIEVDCHVHEIHVIGDEVSMSNGLAASKPHQLQMNISSDYPKASDSLSLSNPDLKLDRSRSVSDMAHRLPPIRHPLGKTLFSDMRRKSMSAVDYERLKIENEVGWLRGRLKVVQEGREKLNLSVGQREREKLQLQPFEDITSQLREVHQLADAGSGRSVRQNSIPRPFSKVKLMSKKRCWRSTAPDLHSA